MFSLIKMGIGLVGTMIEGKQEIKRAEVSAKKRALESKDNWELAMAKASGKSWKDELWTILFVLIIGACFIPWTQPYVFEGFRALEETPTWFQIAVGMSISASFGIKAYDLFKK